MPLWEGMSHSEIRVQIDAVADLMPAAGALALRWFRTPLDVINKAGGAHFDPVTRADREVEAFLLEELAQRFPEHRVFGEETGHGGGNGPLRWVIDPIDGTRAFVSGSPLWGIMVGLDDGERALGGVVHVPYLGETFAGDRSAAWLRRDGQDLTLRARSTTQLEEAILYCTHPDTLAPGSEREAFLAVAGASRMLRYGGDCYSYCLLAMGQVDLVVEGCLQPYDVVPVIPIVEGAGGVMTDWRGGPAEPGGKVIAAATPELHAQALRLLAAAA